MYVAPEPVAQATEALWGFLRDVLRSKGVEQVPDALDRQTLYSAAWLQPELLLAQTCGFPFAKTLRGRVRLVATPCYDLPGCDGPRMCSFVIARRDEGISSLEDLRGKRAAINSQDSNSGMNLFRAAIAPIADGRSFFDWVIETGGHAASIVAVGEGRADCAAIDCVTYGHLQRLAPERLADIIVVARTPSGPGLPFITHGSASDQDVEVLRDALAAAMSEPDLADARGVLALTGFSVLADADYDALLALETEAESLAYPQLR